MVVMLEQLLPATCSDQCMAFHKVQINVLSHTFITTSFLYNMAEVNSYNKNIPVQAMRGCIDLSVWIIKSFSCAASTTSPAAATFITATYAVTCGTISRRH